jgi:hypothetical protein
MDSTLKHQEFLIVLSLVNTDEPVSFNLIKTICEITLKGATETMGGYKVMFMIV